MLSSRMTTDTSDDDSSSNTKSAIIAGSVIGSICILGLVVMWCFLWRRRNRQLRGDFEERQRELESMNPQRSETIRATTEFQWPTRVGEASPQLTQLPQIQDKSEKEVCLNSIGFPVPPGTPASVRQKTNYHISPKSCASEPYQHSEQQDLKLKNSSLSIFQPDIAELPPHELVERYHREPQELPVPPPPPAVIAHELEGHLRLEATGERNRFPQQI